MYFLEAKVPTNNTTVCGLNLESKKLEVRRFELPFQAWSMAINPANGDVYALALDGKLCRVITSGAEPIIQQFKLCFHRDDLTVQFPTIKFVRGMVAVVAYLKTSKEEHRCPNRLFLLDPECKITGTIDFDLQGMIFCRCD